MVLAESATVKAPESAQQVLALLESSRVFGCVVLDDTGDIRWVNGLFARWLEHLAGERGTPKNLLNWLPVLTDRKAAQHTVPRERSPSRPADCGS